ncbi:BLUF domain-containing protein [Arthrobacter sp. B0490]|uniref:BLUF domain-containing protein n=1 Tax=Arthrobacter sp. B0490 TaxID=2058891 RepID=UPI0015E3D0C8|nr:BLUF domain-containing protein [Arthrobacter sp. B0490]
MAESFKDHNEQDSRDDQTQHALTLNVMRRISVSVEELWVHYLSMGGDVDEYEVDAYLHGLMRLPAADRDMLSQSVNEMLDDISRGPRAPFSTSSSDVDLSFGLSTDGLRGAADSRMASGLQVASVVYSSVATRYFSEADLTNLLRSSRHRNGALDLTGLLLYRAGRFLQVLEGPEQSVRNRMRSIATDPRHTGVRILLREKRQQRQFPSWTMRFDSINDTLSDEVPGFERSFVDAGQDHDPTNTVRVTKKLVYWFQQHATHP